MKHLTVCTRISGDHQILPGLPTVSKLNDLVYLPLTNDGKWGVYDQSGTAIENAFNFRGRGRSPIRQSLEIEVPANLQAAADEEIIYVGTLYPHFGHFITTTLSRFWYVQQQPEKARLRLLYHDAVGPERVFLKSYVAQIFRAMDLDIGNFIRFEAPTLLRGQVILPEPAFRENFGAYETLVPCARRIGERIIGAVGTPSDVPLYISKSRMQGGLRGIANETELEETLAERGVVIFHPEQHSFEEQLKVLARHRVVIGSVGSAFHSLIFLSGPRRIVGINQIEALNSNFLILDEAAGHDATYVYATAIEEIGKDSRFQRAFHLSSAREIALELLDLV
jgi:capsular polysaccharide biosynthesis protein